MKGLPIARPPAPRPCSPPSPRSRREQSDDTTPGPGCLPGPQDPSRRPSLCSRASAPALKFDLHEGSGGASFGEKPGSSPFSEAQGHAIAGMVYQNPLDRGLLCEGGHRYSNVTFRHGHWSVSSRTRDTCQEGKRDLCGDVLPMPPAPSRGTGKTRTQTRGGRGSRDAHVSSGHSGVCSVHRGEAPAA